MLQRSHERVCSQLLGRWGYILSIMPTSLTEAMDSQGDVKAKQNAGAHHNYAERLRIVYQTNYILLVELFDRIQLKLVDLRRQSEGLTTRLCGRSPTLLSH